MREPDLRLFFFFNDTATTEIYTLSLHDALPILTLDSCSIMWWGEDEENLKWCSVSGVHVLSNELIGMQKTDEFTSVPIPNHRTNKFS